MKHVCSAVFLICCLLVHLSAVASTGPEEATVHSLTSEGGESADNGYGSVDLSELSEADKQYLGLESDVKPILQNVDADLIVVEFMSTHCPNCRVQGTIFNKLYSFIRNNSTLQSRVKILAISVGNNIEEVGEFRAELNIVFPILTDPDLEIRDRLANSMTTPYTIMLRRDKEGNFVLADSHRGAVKSYRSYFDEIKVVMQYDENMLKLKQAENLTGNVVRKTKLKLSEEELTAKVRESLIEASGDENINVVAKNIKQWIKPITYEKTYVGDSGGVKYFAVVVNEKAICDVCHAIQFIYIFNEKGEVAGFEPVYLVKGMNKAWDAGDIKKIRERVLGMSILKLMSFDPEVDAVTSATITSIIIFKAIAQGKSIYRFMR